MDNLDELWSGFFINCCHNHQEKHNGCCLVVIVEIIVQIIFMPVFEWIVCAGVLAWLLFFFPKTEVL